MPGTLRTTSSKLEQVKTELKSGSPNLEKCEGLLSELKQAVLEFSFLPTGQQSSPEEIKLARDILEYGALFSIKKNDIFAFDRYMAQLKHYYFDLSSNVEESINQNQMIGANLLNLLSQNRVAEFHTEIEILDPVVLHTNPLLAYPVLLEQYMVEGRTNKIFFDACKDPPTECYGFFVKILEDTVRQGIADCVEKSFMCLPQSDAVRVLFASDMAQVEKVAAKKNWKLENGAYHFETPVNPPATIPSKPLISKTLAYARELERII